VNTMHSPASHEPSTALTDDTGPRQPWALLAVALAAQILVVLDISVVNTALPTIGRSLELDGGTLQWLVTAYLMMSGGGLLLGGRISDLLSRRGVFLSGLVLFTGASLASGFAQTGGELIAARAAQGLSAALLTPSALSLVMTHYSGSQRRTALALWGVVGSLGVAAGVLLGGAVTTWAGWEYIFWINAPVGAVALVVGARVITKDPAADAALRDFDLPGAVTVIASLVTLMYGLGQAPSHGWWSVSSAVAFTAAVVLAVVFLKVEARASKPLFPPHVWTLKPLVTGTTVMLGATGILVGAVFLTSIYLQTAFGFSALRTGLAFVPFAVAVTVGAVVAKHLLALISPRAIAITGLAVAAAAAGLLACIPGDSTYLADVLPGLVLVGLGIGMVFVPVSVTAMSGIPDAHAGTASGFLMTGHEVGAALGVAVLSAVATSAGNLTTATGAADGFSHGFLAAGILALVVAAAGASRMSSSTIDASTQMHLHH